MPSPAAARRFPGATAWPAQQIGDLAMPPEQRSDQRSAARAVRFRIQGRAISIKMPPQSRLVGVCGLMERRPAAIVGIVHVGACRQQRLDRGQAAFPVRLAGEADGEIQKRIAIRPALICQPRIALAAELEVPATLPDSQRSEGRHETVRWPPRPFSMRGGSPGLSGRPRSRTHAPVRRPAGRLPR